MYLKDKTNRITLRLNEQQFGFVKNMADVLGVAPSDFLRMVINTAMSTTKMTSNMSFIVNDNTGGIGRENDKTDKHD